MHVLNNMDFGNTTLQDNRHLVHTFCTYNLLLIQTFTLCLVLCVLGLLKLGMFDFPL